MAIVMRMLAQGGSYTLSFEVQTPRLQSLKEIDHFFWGDWSSTSELARRRPDDSPCNALSGGRPFSFCPNSWQLQQVLI